MAEALIEGIEKDAEEEAARLLSEAQRRAEEIRSGANARAEALLKQAEEKASARALQVKERALRSVDGEVKKVALRARDGLRRELLLAVRRELSALPDREDYPEILLSWLVEAAEGMGAKEGLVHAGRKERGYLTAELLKQAEERSGVRLSLAEEGEGGAGLVSTGHLGVIVSDIGGRIVFDNSIDARIVRMETSLRRLIDRELQ